MGTVFGGVSNSKKGGEKKTTSGATATTTPNANANANAKSKATPPASLIDKLMPSFGKRDGGKGGGVSASSALSAPPNPTAAKEGSRGSDGVSDNVAASKTRLDGVNNTNNTQQLGECIANILFLSKGMEHV